MYWVEGKNVSDKSTLADAVKQSGISGMEAVLQAIDVGSFEGSEQRQQLEKATDEAVQRGTPGVPGFWIPEEIWKDRKGDRKKGRLYWGQDRMQFVEAVLLAMNQGRSGMEIGAIRTPLQSLMPRCTSASSIPQGEEVKLEFWYDFSSPWAFLGWTQLARLQQQFGERLHIDMKPFLLGILFREYVYTSRMPLDQGREANKRLLQRIGAPNTPMSAVSEQKRNYSQLDHSDWCRWWNAVNEQNGKPDKAIEFHWADIFPIRTPNLLRAVLVEPKLVGELCKCLWKYVEV